MTLYVQSKFEVIQVIIDRSIERERETERREKRELWKLSLSFAELFKNCFKFQTKLPYGCR